MPESSHVEMALSTVWNGQLITFRQVLPAESWRDPVARLSVEDHLRTALGIEIAKRLDVVFSAYSIYPWEFGY